MFRLTDDCLNCQYLLFLKEEPRLCREKSFEFLGLTPREVEILYWLAQGKTNAEIGLILGSNFRTIKKHLEHIYKKLGVENRTSASIRALEIFGALK